MQNGSSVSLDAGTIHTDCVFCQHNDIATYILKESQSFRIVTDHAPLVEGHILIVPKLHYACYGAVPAELDAELFALKREVQQFFQQFYTPAVFWEHGVFRQTVFHAHLHCFPFGPISQSQHDLCEKLCAQIIHSQDDIRVWYTSKGHYFYLEPDNAFLFAPKMDTYLGIIQGVLWPGTSACTGHKEWRSSHQRYEDGKPLIATVRAKWRIFEQQGVAYADEASA